MKRGRALLLLLYVICGATAMAFVWGGAWWLLLSVPAAGLFGHMCALVDREAT